MIQTYLPEYVRGKNQDPSFAAFANGLGKAVYLELVSNEWYTPERYNNIMSQLSGESGHGTSRIAKTNHNYGGRKSKNGGWMKFKDDADFAKNQVAYIRRRPRMWNAKNIIDFAKAAKSYNYFGADLNKYIKLMQGQAAARSAWESAMKGWGNQVSNKPTLPQNNVDNLDNSTDKTALDYLNDEYRNDTNNMIPAAVLTVTPDDHPLMQLLNDNVVKSNNMPEIGDLFAAALAGLQYLPTPLLGYDNYSQLLPGNAKGKDSVGTSNNPSATLHPTDLEAADRFIWDNPFLKLIDPTGISSYKDVYRSYKQTGLSLNTILQAIGAIPVVGKLKYLAKLTAIPQFITDFGESWKKNRDFDYRDRNALYYYNPYGADKPGGYYNKALYVPFYNYEALNLRPATQNEVDIYNSKVKSEGDSMMYDSEFGYGYYDVYDPPIGLLNDYTKKYGKKKARERFANLVE